MGCLVLQRRDNHSRAQLPHQTKVLYFHTCSPNIDEGMILSSLAIVRMPVMLYRHRGQTG